MNREVLFRGKKVDNGEWVEGYPFGIWEKSYILWGTTNEIPNMIEVTASSKSECTGLTDRNGTKIFEGDILQCNDNPKDLVKAVFGAFFVIDVDTESIVDEVFGWHYEVIPIDALSKVEPFCFSMPLTDYYIDRCSMIIIGNIHDNPELLRGE